MREGFVNDGMFDWSQPVPKAGSQDVSKGAAPAPGGDPPADAGAENVDKKEA